MCVCVCVCMFVYSYINIPRLRIIFSSGGFELFQMVLEPDTVGCASEEAEPRKGDEY